MTESPAPIEIPIPILTDRLPAAQPYADAESVRAAAAAYWATPITRRLLPTGAAYEAYQAQRAHEFTLWCYPALVPQRLPLVVAFNEYGFAVDSIFDDAEADGSEQGLSRYVEAFADLAGQARAVWSEQQHERLMAAVATTFQFLVEDHEGLHKRSSQLIYEHHLNSGWIWVAELVIELAIDVDLSSYFTPDSLLTQYYQAGMSTCVLVNEVFSLGKEYHAVGGSPNVIPALARERGISLREAADAVGAWTLREEQRFFDLRDRILGTPAGADPGVRTFITAFEYFLAGNLHWSRFTPRYHGKGFDYDGTVNGTMVFHPDRTVYVPEMPVLAPDRIPAHVAVVMDGNGRWAERRGLPRSAGHWTALARIFEITDGALQIGVPWLTVFAFSSENWQRSTDEVTQLIDICRAGAGGTVSEVVARGIRFRWCGVPDGLPEDLIEALHELERLTAGGAIMTYTLCFNYGGRADILRAARSAIEHAQAGQLPPTELTEADLDRFMLTADLPDVDLLIRTGGEQRLSNFMLWPCAYAEIMFVPQLWPEFTRKHLWEAIESYAHRDRRFGEVPSP